MKLLVASRKGERNREKDRWLPGRCFQNSRNARGRAGDGDEKDGWTLISVLVEKLALQGRGGKNNDQRNDKGRRGSNVQLLK